LHAFVKVLELELDLAIDEARSSILSDSYTGTSDNIIADIDVDSCVDAAVFWSSETVLSPNGKLVTSITKDLSKGDQSAMRCVLQEISVDESFVHSSPQRETFDINSIVADADTYHAEYRIANLDDEFKKAFDRQEKVSAVSFHTFFLLT